MNQDSANAVKAKKTRRRLRLSCIECTKRRQKCDRASPCGLCASRGIPHLCRWATTPFARPTPAKPPAHAKGQSAELEDKTNIQKLSDRICLLERQLEQYRNPNADYSDHFDSRSTSPYLSTPSLYSRPSSPDSAYWTDGTGQRPPPSQLSLNSIALASIVPSFRLLMGCQDEYLGPASSLHQVVVPSLTPQANAPLTNEHFHIFMRTSSLSHDALNLASIVEKIPPAAETEQLLTAYFNFPNWNFGLPEGWIRTAVFRTWDFLHQPASFPDAYLNPNWLCLLFAILASAPLHALVTDYTHNSEHFLMCSSAALRIADNTSTAGGNILACVAMPLLAKRYASSGKLSEAWNLLGRGIRVAEALGLRHDSECGQQGAEDEKYIRKLAWDNLAIWDRFYSLLLGRASMSFQRFKNACPPACNLEGASSNYLSAVHELSLLAEDINELYLSPDSFHVQTYLTLDYKLHTWEKTFNVGDETVPGQKFSLSSWSLFLKMKLHASLPIVDAKSATSFADTKSCVDACIELIEMQCAAHDWSPAGAVLDTSQSFNSCPETLPILLESSLTLALQPIDRPEQQTNIVDLMYRVYRIFHGLYSQQNKIGAGNIPYAGLTIMQVLIQTWLGGDDSTQSSRVCSPSTLVEEGMADTIPFISKVKANLTNLTLSSDAWSLTNGSYEDTTPTVGGIKFNSQSLSGSDGIALEGMVYRSK